MQKRLDLIEVLKAKAVLHLPEPVELASGALSSTFVDVKLGLAHWQDLALASEVITTLVHDAGIEFDAVGGPTMGANALAVGIAACAESRWFFIDKDPSDHPIVGSPLTEADRVLLVEDTVSTGGSIIKAIGNAIATGAQVVAVATVVDRGDQATQKFADLQIPYFAAATYTDLGIEPLN